MSKPFDRIGREFRTLQHVKRWAIIRTHRDQSVAEHTLMVVHLVDRFYDYLDENFRGRNLGDKTRYLRGALYHDLGEICSGDVAHPAKMAYRIAPGSKDAYKEWEAERLAERFPWLAEEQDPFIRGCIGLMDMLEAWLFLQEELRMGNREVESIREYVGVKLEEYVAAFHGQWGFDPSPFVEFVRKESYQCDKVVKHVGEA